MTNQYVDILVRLLLSGDVLQTPKHSKAKYYYLREDTIRCDTVHSIIGKKVYGYDALECYEVSLPLSETYEETADHWVAFELYAYERDNKLWVRLSNQYVGYERNLIGEQRDAYYKLRLEYS